MSKDSIVTLSTPGVALLIAVVTNSVVAICLSLVPASAVGAKGLPVSSGDSMLAFRSRLFVTSVWLAFVLICSWIPLVTPWTKPISSEVVSDEAISPLSLVTKALLTAIGVILLKSW